MKKRLIPALLTVLALAFTLSLLFFSTVEKTALITTTGRSFEKARVMEIVQDNLQEDGSRIGPQIVRLRILSGSNKEREVTATSFAGYLHGAICRRGMTVIAEIDIYQNQITASVYNYYRAPQLYLMVAIFLLGLWLIGGRKGARSAIGLLFTFICIIYLFLPMLYRGCSPFWSAVLIVIITTTVSITLIGGLTGKSLAAILGTIGGVIIAGIAADIFGALSHISGNNVADIEELTYIGLHTNIQVSGLLFSGLLIASLGAIMDVAMSISSTVNEIHNQNRSLSGRALFLSGMNVGRDMMGTMANTLILAFTGGTLNTLIILYSYDMQYQQVMNMYSIGIEIMRAISGSLGLICTVPLVSGIAAFFISRRKKTGPIEKSCTL